MKFQQLSIFILITTLAVLASAAPAAAHCTNSPKRPMVDGYPPPPGIASEHLLNPRDACPVWRWVAVKRDAEAACPVPAPAGDQHWQVRQLFESRTGEALPPALRPFCLYKVERAHAETLTQLNDHLQDLLRGGELSELSSGCAALAPAAPQSHQQGGNQTVDPVSRAHYRSRLYQHFLTQVEAPADQPGREVRPELAPAPRVRLTLLDTQPTGNLDVAGNSNHGYTLAHLAQQLVCEHGPDAGCAAEVRTRLALPISQFARDNPAETHFDWEQGGYFGTIDQLAQSLWRELEDLPDVPATPGQWASVRRQPSQHLVLNLSVAWVGELWGGLERRPSDMPAPVRALYRTLQAASCRGALVIAAAGNRRGGPELESGPLLPAGWERRQAPDRSECRELFAVEASAYEPRDMGPAWRRLLPERLLPERMLPERMLPEWLLPEGRTRVPLIYAVGGIHGDGQTLINARPDSEPPRVAYADHVGTPDGSGSTLTGSSVATSVVAAAAAVVWHQRPELSPAEVMALVEAAGRPLGRSADVYLGTTAPPVRRIGVCPALARALGNSDASCPPLQVEPPMLSDLGFQASVERNAQTLTAQLNTEHMDQAFCGADIVYHDPDRIPANPCPMRQFYTIQARPWTGPQPQSNPCMECEITEPPPSGGHLASTSRQAPQRNAAAQKTVQSGWQLHIRIDPEWTGGELRSPVLSIGTNLVALPLEPMQAGDTTTIYGIDGDQYGLQARGISKPPVLLYFLTDDGSTESPVFISH